MKLLNTKQVVLRLAIIIAFMEFLIMMLLQTIPFQISQYTEAMIDTALLAILSTPAIYIWVIKPFVDTRDEALAQVSHMTLTDPLTQLANRRLIAKHLAKLIAGSTRHNDHGAMLLIDLDKFKPVNDNHGHEAGDAILVEVATRLTSSVRSEDVVGRIGGDEFVVLVHRLDATKEISEQLALLIANKLIKNLIEPFEFKGKSLQVGASIGIRLLGFEKTNITEAMTEADMAMYLAKKAGRGRAVIFEQDQICERVKQSN